MSSASKTPAASTAREPEARITGGCGWQLKVASLNVLNYFTTLDTGIPNAGPNDDQGARGADDLTPEITPATAEFERQATKLVNTIRGHGRRHPRPGGARKQWRQAIADLVGRSTSELGATAYAFISTGDAGDDAITNGIIYKPAAAAPVGDVAVLRSMTERTSSIPSAAVRPRTARRWPRPLRTWAAAN